MFLLIFNIGIIAHGVNFKSIAIFNYRENIHIFYFNLFVLTKVFIFSSAEIGY